MRQKEAWKWKLSLGYVIVNGCDKARVVKMEGWVENEVIVHTRVLRGLLRSESDECAWNSFNNVRPIRVCVGKTLEKQV